MSGEITVNASGQIARGTAPYNVAGEIFPGGQFSYDASANLRDTVIKSIPASDTNLTTLLPNTATKEGVMYIKNLDATNYVEFGPTSGGAIVPFIRLNPGKASPAIPLVPGLTLRGRANTAACDCDIRIYAGNGTSGA